MSNHLDYEINKELGECYLFMGELDKAEDYYIKAADSTSSQAEPYFGLAAIAVQRGDLNKALNLYRKAQDTVPNDKALAGMGLMEMEIGSRENAMALFSAALERNPENMIALFGTIQAGHHLNRLNEVIIHLQNFLQLNSKDHKVRYSLAGCFFSLGKNDLAKKELETILASDPEYADVLELLQQIN